MKKALASLLVAAMMVLALTSCTPSGGSSNASATPAPSSEPSPSSAAPDSSAPASASSAAFSYPIPGNHVLTYFGRLHSKIASNYKSYADLPVVQYWFKQTGVTLDFNTPPSGMETEQLNIVLASGDLPDIISYDLQGMPGGLQKLYQDKVLIKLTDHMADWMPNLSKYYKDHPEIDRQVKDDNGDYFVVPFLKGGGYLLATDGPMIRKDVLDKVGLAPPETIDEWKTAFAAIHKAYPDAYPLTGRFIGDGGAAGNLVEMFQPAFGIGDSKWYLDDAGTAHFAPLEAGYEDFLKLLNEWYKGGILDPNFATLDDAAQDNAMSSGKSFATFNAGSSGLGAYMTANKDNPTFKMVGVRVPTMNKDELAKYSADYEYGGNPQIGITTACKDPEVAMRMYDYAFTDENELRFNFGIEGESYTMVDGKPKYTDLILKNPDGLNVDTILAKYATTAIKAPIALVQDPEYIVQYYNMPEQQQAMNEWMKKDMDHRSWPPVSLTDQESAQLTQITADLFTYVDQTSLKFILGTESFDNWNNFVNTMKSMGAEDALKIQQAAASRYLAR